MAGWTEIANMALTELGAAPTTNIDTDTKEPVQALRARREEIRDMVLRSHPWNFAKRRASLPADAEAPAFGYDKAYTLPTDPYCLRVWRLDPDAHGDDVQWEVEGRKILTDEGAPLKIHYIARIDDPTQYDGLFIHALVKAWAAATAYRVTKSRSLAADLRQAFIDTVRQARVADGQEGKAIQPITGYFAAGRRGP